MPPKADRLPLQLYSLSAKIREKNTMKGKCKLDQIDNQLIVECIVLKIRQDLGSGPMKRVR